MVAQLTALRAGAPWRVRLAVLPCAQAVGFLHCLTAPPRRPSPLLTIIEKSLVDTQPENRDRAMVCLSHLAPCMAAETLQALGRRFVKLCNASLPE